MDTYKAFGIITPSADLLTLLAQEGNDHLLLTFPPEVQDAMANMGQDKRLPGESAVQQWERVFAAVKANRIPSVTITEKILRAIAPFAPKDVGKYVDPLNAAMQKYEINTQKRAAAFLAQIAHESGQFRYVREIWGPTKQQLGYEGRKDLGNTQTGDGKRFMGRGLIQITGRANYEALSAAIGRDFVAHPELLEEPQYATYSAAWFWDMKRLNGYADMDAFITITRRINGSTTGLKERMEYWERAKAAL